MGPFVRAFGFQCHVLVFVAWLLFRRAFRLLQRVTPSFLRGQGVMSMDGSVALQT